MTNLSPVEPKAQRRCRVVHLTSVHPLLDNRIFEKECVSLAEAGYDVALVVPDPDGDRVLKGVRILTVPVPSGKSTRLAWPPKS